MWSLAYGDSARDDTWSLAGVLRARDGMMAARGGGGPLVQSHGACLVRQQAFFQNLCHDFALAILSSAKSCEPRITFAQLAWIFEHTTLH